jgi:Flp pilus assembly protein TadG
MMNDLCCDSAQKRKANPVNHSVNEPRKASSKGGSLLARVRSLFVSDSEGGALVEMAVTLPIIMAVMTGIFSFSIALYQKLQLAEAVSNAGHLLATDRGDTDPCTTATNAIYAAAPGLAQSKLTLTYTLNGDNYGSGVTTCPGASGAANSNMVAGQNAEIQATYTCSLGVYGTKYTSCNIASQITEVVQ